MENRAAGAPPAQRRPCRTCQSGTRLSDYGRRVVPCNPQRPANMVGDVRESPIWTAVACSSDNRASPSGKVVAEQFLGEHLVFILHAALANP